MSGGKAAIYEAAWREEIAAPDLCDAAVEACRAFATATGCPAGENVIRWLLDRSTAADRAGWNAVREAA